MTDFVDPKSVETQFGNWRLIVEYETANPPQWSQSFSSLFTDFNVKLVLPSGKKIVFENLRAHTKQSHDGWRAFLHHDSVEEIERRSYLNLDTLMENGYFKTVSGMFHSQMLDKDALSLIPDPKATSGLLAAILITVIESFVIEIFLKQKSSQL